jgi:proline iminopeptidase
MKIEMYYMHNLCFMPDRHIPDNAHRLTMPIYLIQGRYDMVCPPVTAYELHRKLPDSKLYWTVSGHRGEHETWTALRLCLAQALED